MAYPVAQNNSDAWAWVTTYARAHSEILNARCLAPGESMYVEGAARAVQSGHGMVTRVLVAPYEVRFEIERAECRHPVMLDATLGYDGRAPYYITGSAGHYAVRHTP